MLSLSGFAGTASAVDARFFFPVASDGTRMVSLPTPREGSGEGKTRNGLHRGTTSKPNNHRTVKRFLYRAAGRAVGTAEQLMQNVVSEAQRRHGAELNVRFSKSQKCGGDEEEDGVA